MRWDNLRLDVAQKDERLTLPLFEQGAVVRQFDTPEFRGVTFYEVRAKSIINKVAEASRVPFRWTINPYRGCTHACAYCLSGETPIMMADGRTKPIAELRPADKIYGTVRDGVYRRYVTTHVRAHWSTVKTAYRVALEDGTELIASGDHRFLTERGWKHVADNPGGMQRAHLTTNNRLFGTGRFSDRPEHDSEYRLGYLCGMIRGDANLGAYTYTGRRKNPETHYRFRLALVDLEALRRTREYLMGMEVRTDEFAYTAAAGARKPLTAIRTQTAEAVRRIHDVIRWPDRPSESWTKGFLAGIFDAEGGYCGGVLRIANTDPEILGRVRDSLGRFGFRAVSEPTGKANGLAYVRVAGGIAEHLRFFHTVDPAITRKRTIEPGRSVKTKGARLRVVDIEPLGVEMPMYDITTGTGDFIANGVVSHNCFARNTHTYLGLNYGEDFDTKVVVKVNAPELLRKELAAKKWAGEHIAMGTNVDPYQRAEGRYKLMRGILEALRDHSNPFSILTKGTLILRDLDVLKECAEVAAVGTNVSVGFVDKEMWRALEPGTPSPEKRLDVCRTLNESGIPCGVLMAPVIPFITDTDEILERTVKLIADAGATHVAPIVLHLRTGAREWFMKWLGENQPHLVPRYEELYARGAYAPKTFQQEVSDRVHALARRYGVGKRGARDARRITRREQPQQLSLV